MEPNDGTPALPFGPGEVIETVDVDTRPRAVNAWVAALPMSDPGASGRALLGQLRALQGARLGADARYQLLELLRPAAERCCTGLKESALRPSSAPAERLLERSALVQQLHAQMALGYQRVCESLLASPRLWPSRKPLALALGRALRQRGAQLLGVYQSYIAPPPQLWLAIHRLYRIAEAHGLEQLPATEPEDPQRVVLSIAQAYRRLLLIAVADPYGLRPAELDRIFAQLPHWPDAARLTAQADPPDPFMVNLESDQPPLRREHHAGPWTEHCRGLHSATLVTELQRRLAGSQPPSESELNVATLRHLIRVWGEFPARQHPRSERMLTLEVVLGLSATHHLIAQPQVPERETKPETSRSNAADPPSPPRPLPEALATQTGLWQVHCPAPVPTQVPETDLPAVAASDQAPPPITVVGGYASYARSATDVSIGGYRLLWRAPSAAGLLVGEVIGLRPLEPGAAHRPWAVGVIRWLRRGDDGSLTGGVQLLAPAAVAVGCRPSIGGGYLKGLLLSALRPIGQPATLLLPSIRCSPGERMEIIGSGTSLRVELTELVSSSAVYRQFHYLLTDD